MKTHNDKYGPQLLALLMGEAEGRAKTKIESHLAGCERCQAEMEELRAAVGTVEAAFTSSESPADALDHERILNLEEQHSRGGLGAALWRFVGLNPRNLIVAGALAAVLMALVLPELMNSDQPGQLSKPRRTLAKGLNQKELTVWLTEGGSGPLIYDPSNGTISAGDIVRTRKGVFSPFTAGIGGLSGPVEGPRRAKIASAPAEAVGGRYQQNWRDNTSSSNFAMDEERVAAEGETYVEVYENLADLAYLGAGGAAPTGRVRSSRGAGADASYSVAVPATPQGTPMPSLSDPRTAMVIAKRGASPRSKKAPSGIAEDQAWQTNSRFSGEYALDDQYELASPAPTDRLPQGTPVPEPYIRRQRRVEAEPPADRWEYRGGRAEPGMMYFRNYGVNPFVATNRDPLSTFAVDVDKASYAIVRNYLNREILPPTAAVRVEEIVNYFTPDYAPPTNDTFAVYNTMAPSPFRKGHHLLRVGIQGRKEGEYERKPLVLTFVVDVSGSMSQENRLGLVKRTLLLLLDELRPGDRIGIAVYESRGRQVMNHRYVRDGRKIKRAINGLRTGGSTYAEEGIRIGFDMARRAFDPSATNRVILCSDGVANVGNTGPEAILRRIEEAAGEDIYLSSLGFGMGNYNDVLMEQLANKGNGHYAYLDTLAEAKRFVRKDLVSSMNVIAQDVKIQVEFDPASVSHYRLLGYENRDVRDRDFRNDRVDAGEIGAGHATTALYELNLNPHGNDRIATVRIRFKDTTRNMAVREIQGPVARSSAEAPFFDTSDHFQLVAAASQYAEILRESYLSRGVPMSQVLSVFDDALGRRPRNAEAKDLRKLIVKADRLLGDRDDVPMVLTEQFRDEQYEDVPMPGRVPMTESGGAPRY